MSGERVEVESDGAVPLDVIRETGVRGAPDVDGLATVNGRRAMVMVWSYQDSQDMVREDPAVETRVAVSGLPTGVKHVRVREWAIDETHSNAYTVWKAMGSPTRLNAEEAGEAGGGGAVAGGRGGANGCGERRQGGVRADASG